MDSNFQQDELMKLYAEMSDLELRELHDDEADLTETARSILRDEIRKRKLDLSAPARVAQPAQAAHPSGEIADGPVEYTWKTDLFTFSDSDDAYRTTLALKQAGIESFIRRPDDRYNAAPFAETTVQVPADQLAEAQAVLAQLTPEKLRALEPDMAEPGAFEAPACPSCHSNASLLVNTEPVNRWECDECGYGWNEPAGLV